MSAEPTTFPTRREQLALFTRNFFKHPKMLGSIIPSSRFLIERLLRQVSWKRARVIVEYGPGVGTFTGEILRRMRRDAVLVVLETNPEFVSFLRHAYQDPRLHVVHGSAAEVEQVLAQRGLGKADYVISGIPFSTLPEQLREDILQATREVLRPKGALLIYQFSPKVLPHLQRIFSTVRRSFEPFNVLPAQLFYCMP
jgi:phospholipid N-methyltransferase